MKIGNSTTRPIAGTYGPSGVQKARATGAGTVSAPASTTAVAGIPENELTPRVKAAINRLLEEVQNMREELDQAKRRIAYLERLSDEDPLLPLVNRRAFVRELGRFMSFAERYDAPGVVVYFDVDGMKGINDTHGHAAGDEVLRHVAEVLIEHVRESDVVGRLGGDEFGVILAQVDEETARHKAQELIDAIISTPVNWKGHELRVSVAYGLHRFAGGEEIDDMLSAADRAMYINKRSGNKTPREP